MPQTVNVLLIEDDPEYATLVKTWLASSKDVEFIVNWSDTLMGGMDRIASGGIDIILLDLSLPDSDGPQTFHVVRTRARQIPIVLLSGNDHESLALGLVSAGAQDYLVKSSCTAEALTRAILYAVVRHPRRREQADTPSARVIGLMSAKGGVGVTTLACVLAAELRHQQQGDVLLADLELHGNGVSFLLGINPAYSLLDALENTHRLDESCWNSIVSKAAGDLHVLPSPALQGQPEPGPDKIRQLLNRLTIFYPWIVLDLGRLDSRSTALLESVNEVILVTSTTLASLHETRRALTAIRGAGFEAENLHLAVSELPANRRLSEASLEEMVGAPIGLHLPESSEDLEGLASPEGLPKQKSRYRENVAKLARTLTGAPEEKPTTKRLAQMLGWR